MSNENSYIQLNLLSTEAGCDAFAHVSESQVIEKARDILAERMVHADVLANPSAVTAYLVAKFAGLEHEVFGCLFLDSRHRVLRYEEMFRGTIDGCSVHPREVVKAALTANAAAVIFSHNHPSGVADPSRADKQLTKRLTDALALVDVRVLDHFVVGGVDTISFAERGHYET
jgi:DNA repair protein RadC